MLSCFPEHCFSLLKSQSVLQVMNKEVDDIIKECIQPNFVELPQVIEQLPNPTMQGQYHIQDTDMEDELCLTEEEDISQGRDNENQVLTDNFIKQSLLLH